MAQAVVNYPKAAVTWHEEVVEEHRIQTAVIVKILGVAEIRDGDCHVSVKVGTAVTRYIQSVRSRNAAILIQDV